MDTPRDARADLSPRKMAEQLKEEGKDRLERGKAGAADQVDQVANALRNAGDELGTQSALGSYANRFADSIGDLGRRLRERRIEDLAVDMQAAARRNPTMFLLGGLGLGIVLARLVRASTPQDSDYEAESFTGEDEFGTLGEGSGSGGWTTDLESSTNTRSGSGVGESSSPQKFGE
jgi:hypothetical protein